MAVPAPTRWWHVCVWGLLVALGLAVLWTSFSG